MSFLNPFGFLVGVFILFVFWDLLFFREKSLYIKQTKLMILALLFLAFALTRPVIKEDQQTQKIEAKEYIIALDSSFSMLAEDIKPNRFDVARDTIISLLEKSPKDRFSIFIFTSNPLLISPPTTDTDISIVALEAINPAYILTKSTSIKKLIKAMQRFHTETKEMILFSDGGEEKDIQTLVDLAKEAKLKINVVAVGSKKGTVLKKNGTALTDTNGKLVVSRVNPLLKDLASATGGFYIPLQGNEDISQKIIDTLTQKNRLELETSVQSYQELFYIPLGISFVLLLVAFTRYIELMPFLTLLVFVSLNLSSLKAEDGFSLYKQHKYLQSAQTFLKMEPSKESYYNAAVAFYKAKRYKKALELLHTIKTKDPLFKANIFYNMAQCAVGLKHYDRAMKLYQKTLLLNPDDKEAKENLLELYKHNFQTQQDVADMMPHVNDKQSSNLSKTNETKQEEKKQQGKNHNSSKQALQSNFSQGSSQKKKKNSQSSMRKKSKNQAEYKFGYNAYELINKGYINETHPW